MAEPYQTHLTVHVGCGWVTGWLKSEVWCRVKAKCKLDPDVLALCPAHYQGTIWWQDPGQNSLTRPRGQHTRLITMLSQVPEIYPLPAAHLLLLMFSLHSNRLQRRVFGCCPKWMLSVPLVFFKVWLKLWNQIDFLHLVLPIRSH